jgi:radical SAM protein with 4Fe4S-binding SPASM domain
MTGDFTSRINLPAFPLWERTGKRHIPISFDLELTARCNNNCRHCYINLPATDREAERAELSPDEIGRIADQAASLGSLWCLLTGGEPLLREDFCEIYKSLKKKGFLLSVFTNGCLITEEHIELFRKYPPRNIEVTVYGASRETYECVTRRPGSYAAFRRGLDMLTGSGIRVGLKAMAIRSTMHELPGIARFCRERTVAPFRFDPLLHLRYDGDESRNTEIIAERLSPDEIVSIEQSDEERAEALLKGCNDLIIPEFSHENGDRLFRCGAGNNSFTVGYDGSFRLCSSLWHPDCIYDLRKGSLADAWNNLVPRVREMRSEDQEYLATCRKCPIVNLCLWCPAHAHLESGRMDKRCEYFCDVAHARAAALEKKKAVSRP